MNLLSKLPQGLTRTFGKLWLKTKNVSPEICVIGGIVCGAGALVAVGVQTWKKKEKLSEDSHGIKELTIGFKQIDDEQFKNLTKKEEKKLIMSDETGERYLPVKIDKRDLTDDQKKLLLARRIDFAKDIVKAYWPAVALEVGSVVLIWKGRSILRKNLSAMTAAYAALAEAYRKYRERVRQEIGAEREEQLALGYSLEERVDENGNVQKVLKPEADGNRNAFGFWLNEGYYDKTGKELVWRNFVYSTDKKEDQWKIKEEQERSTRELRTIGYWRLENTMLRLGQPPKEAAKFHDIGKVWKEGSDNKVDFGVFEGPTQLECNKGFTDPYCSQTICYINPNIDGDGYIGYINENLEKYDFRYAKGAESELPYKSFVRESNRLIERYNKEKMEEMIFKGMSDRAQRKFAKMLK